MRQQGFWPKAEAMLEGVVGQSGHDWVSKLLSHKCVISPLQKEWKFSVQMEIQNESESFKWMLKVMIRFSNSLVTNV